VLSNEPSIMTMTTLREFDEYTFTHSVNVCIFSVIIGQRLGLSRLQLYDLGLAALFHDVGKMRLPSDVINKSGPLKDSEWKALQEHPTEGPTNRRARLPSLYSRIVAVADAFDAGTSIRSYQYEAWPPDEVLQEMRDNPRRGFDPLLVKALINATGVYPVGTLVILDSLELAVVAQANADPDQLHLPLVKVISDPAGVPLSEPHTVDLSQLDPETGKPVRTIIKTTDPQKYGIRVADYLV